MKKAIPSPNGENGRDGKGRFTKGNPGGPGNPEAARVSKWRSAFLGCATEKDIRGLYRSLMTAAELGDVAAAKILLQYLVGQPPEIDAAQATGAVRVVIVREDNWRGGGENGSHASASSSARAPASGSAE